MCHSRRYFSTPLLRTVNLIHIIICTYVRLIMYIARSMVGEGG